ncbi:MAG: DUF4082 domain-containing protein [Steroidobacteraceae bacterium]|jgi:hypothetical protein|nr:DUF4082 domain-containing protein [Steroidobacteraceae bacterium]
MSRIQVGSRARHATSSWLAVLALLLFASAVPLESRAQSDPARGPGGPVLVLTSGTASFGTFYAEILRAEGLNAFEVADISTLTTSLLGGADVVVLARTALTSSQASLLSEWVTGGGKLIAMDPDPQLSGLLGIAPNGGTLSGGYLRIEAGGGLGTGFPTQTLQFHGTARTFTASGATTLATLYSSATQSAGVPAITLRSAGTNGGQAVAYTFDLATSIVRARQGNPAWASQERDGRPPIRSNDKYYGPSTRDPQPDWIDLDRLWIPQADEQQRFFAKLVTELSLDRRPLPRFWYLPDRHRAAVVLTGDDHGVYGPAQWLDRLIASSPSGCSVDRWECVRATVYASVVPSFQFGFGQTPLSDAQAASYVSRGFEIASHLNTNCQDFTPSSLASFVSGQLTAFAQRYPSVPAPTTNRYHCVVWSDWASGATVVRTSGIRLDTSYYLWPPEWVANRPGHFTGSAMPMRFAALDGRLIDVYQVVTQMTDESGQWYPFTIDTLLDRALGSEEHYGVYTVNSHTDAATTPVSDSVVASARARGVPVVNARQMLAWLDGRNASSFGSLARSGEALSFSVAPGAGASGLQAMLPYASRGGTLQSLRRGTADVPYVLQALKGTVYAVFAATAGTYTANWGGDTTAPTVASRSPAAGATGVSTTTTVTASFAEPLDPASVNANTFQLRTAGGTAVAGTVTYVGGTSTAVFTPAAALAANATYAATLKGGATDPRIEDAAGNALAADVTWSFTTAAGPACPCSAFAPDARPAVESFADASPVELGVRFRPSVSGWVTGLRFYKGAGNGGTHVGNLWSAGGALLASATFRNETATGWQTVTFANPVAVTAGTAYVASYFAPQGGYAATAGFFASTGFTSGPLYLFRDGEGGGNGLFRYGSTSGFPTQSYQGTNYWIDVVFATSVGGGADTTPPTVTSVAPASGATGVPTTTTVVATFSEPLDAATVSTGTVELRSGSGTLVPAAVAYDATSRRVTLTPNVALPAGTAHTFTLRGGATDPRIKDVAGNALAATYTAGFSTGAAGGDTTRPTVTARVPAAGATGVATSTTIVVTFSEPLAAASVTTGAAELRGAGGALISTAIAYDAAGPRVTLTPSAALAAGTGYTVTVRGGTTGARVTDLAGNALAADDTWSFTTASSGGGSVYTLFPAGAVPQVPENADTGSVELGVKFRPAVDGAITGLRFYKGSSANAGPHVGNLWSATGARLATGTFQNETASGWQTLTFTTPVAVTAGTVYVASYFAPAGRYASNTGFFATAGTQNGPLYALRDGESGGNGVYRYGTSSGFPTATWQSTNYWVDVIFVPR